MQRILNYGSFLQAYGLKKILEELGCQVEFVDYHPGKCLIETPERIGMQRTFYKVIEVLGYRASIKDKFRFIKYKKGYAKKNFPLLGVKEDKQNYFPKLDVLVIGSDEVFNCVQGNTNVGYSRELFGYGSNAIKTVTYAASFGNTTFEKIKEYHIIENVKEDICKLDNLSVRDRNSQNIINKLTGNIPLICPDPVLLYDWKKCIVLSRKVKDKYIVVYGYSGRFSNEECRQIKEFAKKRKLQIISIGGIQEIKNSFVDCSPFEVFSYFSNAEYVVTDTFHGVILSIVTKKKFVVFVRNQIEYGNAQKIEDLLERLGIQSRKLISPLDLENQILQDIDYFELEKNYLEKWREDGYEYLTNIFR